jgi:hypothetical protein
MLIWRIEIGMHDYIYSNGGPYGYPYYSDKYTYVAPSLVFGWRW